MNFGILVDKKKCTYIDYKHTYKQGREDVQSPSPACVSRCLFSAGFKIWKKKKKQDMKVKLKDDNGVRWSGVYFFRIQLYNGKGQSGW